MLTITLNTRSSILQTTTQSQITITDFTSLRPTTTTTIIIIIITTQDTRHLVESTGAAAAIATPLQPASITATHRGTETESLALRRTRRRRHRQRQPRRPCHRMAGRKLRSPNPHPLKSVAVTTAAAVAAAGVVAVTTATRPLRLRQAALRQCPPHPGWKVKRGSTVPAPRITTTSITTDTIKPVEEAAGPVAGVDI